MGIIKSIYGIERDAEGISCECGGYAELVPNTVEECKEFGCGRDTPQWSCCARAFICKICKTRIVGTAKSPEME